MIQLQSPKVTLFGDQQARRRSLIALNHSELDWWTLQQAKEMPTPVNVRQYFTGALADSLILSASTGSITSLTGIFTPSQANQAFPLGYGIAAPFAAQVYRFAIGGICTTGTTGTMIITPFHGPGTAQVAVTGGTSMGASGAQTYTASQTNIPWRIEGELVYRTISAVATTSTAWLVGSWNSVGAIATAGSAWVSTFGSTSAVSVDTTGTGTAGSFGALNFAITFSVAGTVTAEYTVWQSLN